MQNQSDDNFQGHFVDLEARAREDLAAVLAGNPDPHAAGKRSAAAGGSGSASTPDGNHGDNLQTSIPFHLDVAAEELHEALARAQQAGWSQEFMSRLSRVINDLADLRGLAS